MTQDTDTESQLVEADETSNVMEYVAACRQRIWLIGSLTLVFGGTVALWSYTQIPIYLNRAKLVVELQDPKVIDTQLQQEYGTSSEVQIKTHVKLITSYPVIEEVVEKLNLAQQPEYQYRPSGLKWWIQNIKVPWIRDGLAWGVASAKVMKRKVVSSIKAILGLDANEDVESETIKNISTEMIKNFPNKKNSSLVRAFKRHVNIKPVKKSKIVVVSIESEDPEFGALAANTLAQVYIKQNQKRKSQFSEFASDWFASQLDDLRGKLEESEQVLSAFQAEHGLVNLDNQQSVVSQRLANQNLELIAAEKARTEAQTRYKQIDVIRAKIRSQANQQHVDRSDLDSLSEVLDSNVIRDLRAREIESMVELANLSEKYGPLHPKMIQGKTQLKELQARMAEELDKVYGSVKNDYQLALSREKAVREQLKQQSAEKNALNKYAVQASLLEREAVSNRQIYDLFLQQMTQTDLSTQIETSNIYLAEPAITNSTPIRPNTPRSTLLGLIVGLMSGIGLALFLEYGSKTINGPRDLARYFDGFLTIGMVPQSPKFHKSGLALIMNSDPMGVVANCYRHIRTSLWIAMESEPPFSVAITSPSDREGKTTLAANLAIALAQVDDVKVVLIDTDFRRPRIGRIFGINDASDKEKAKGLVQYLTGEAEEGEILHDTKVPNLAVIPAGPLPPHPTEMLHSNRMRKLLQWCQQQGISVVLDTPAALPVVDAMIVSNLVAGTILVVSAGETTKDDALKTAEKFMKHGIKILGVVMQKVPLNSLPPHYRDSPYFAYSDRKNFGLGRRQL